MRASRRGLRMGTIAVAAFLIILIARFPAPWAAGLLPRGVSCEQLDGTLWSGACSGLAAERTTLGDLSWSLHPLALLTGRLDVDASLARPDGTASGRVQLSPSGVLAARDVHANLLLDHALLAQLSPGTHAHLEADLASLRWDGKRITQLQGQMALHGLTDDQSAPLGDFRLVFPASAGDPVGQLTDLGGPLAVQGTVRLTGEPGYVVDGLVAARPGASASMVQQLRYLGTPDAQGRRPFSFAGTF